VPRLSGRSVYDPLRVRRGCRIPAIEDRVSEDKTSEEFEDDTPDEEFEEDLDEDALDLVEEDDPDLVVDDDDDVDDVDPATDAAAVEPEIPSRRKKAAADDEDEEDEEVDPDDVEADLDTILKDRIASGDDLDEEEEEEAPDRNDPDTTDSVAAKKEGEFTCSGCFMIVHPRQFGRRDKMICPEGYDPCPAMAVVAKMR